MPSENPSGNNNELRQAQELIARQETEIRRLREQLSREQGAANLQRILSLAAATATIAAPVSHTRLLEMIVEVAAKVISAKAASLFLIDQKTQELVFEVALGQKAEAVKQFRVPLGHGIAGLVAVSGQPIAISNADQDARQASDIAQAIGYRPQSILCVPLIFEDRITGVLELLDKEGAATFSPGDMYILGLFANQAAVAIELSGTDHKLDRLIARVMSSHTGQLPAVKEVIEQEIRLFDTENDTDQAYSRALELAHLVQEIAWKGENEFKVCQSILQSFAGYLEKSGERLWQTGELF